MNRFFGVPLRDVNSVKNSEDLKWYLKGVFINSRESWKKRMRFSQDSMKSTLI